MRLQVGRIDHELGGRGAFARQSGEYLVERSNAAPTDEAIVDRRGRTLLRRALAPPQPVPSHEDDAAGNPPVIDPRHAVRQYRTIRRIRAADNQTRSFMTSSSRAAIESIYRCLRKPCNWS